MGIQLYDFVGYIFRWFSKIQRKLLWVLRYMYCGFCSILGYSAKAKFANILFLVRQFNLSSSCKKKVSSINFQKYITEKVNVGFEVPIEKKIKIQIFVAFHQVHKNQQDRPGRTSFWTYFIMKK